MVVAVMVSLDDEDIAVDDNDDDGVDVKKRDVIVPVNKCRGCC